MIVRQPKLGPSSGVGGRRGIRARLPCPCHWPLHGVCQAWASIKMLQGLREKGPLEGEL